MLKGLLLGTCAAFLLVSSADAADQAPPPYIKARPRFAAAAVPPVLSGFYAGVGNESAVANASAANPNAGTTLYTAGTGIKGVLGYAWANPLASLNPLMPSIVAVEYGVNWQNLGGTQVCATGVTCSIGSTWSMDVGVMVSCNWTAPLALFPALSNIFGTGGGLPTIPTTATLISSTPYCGGWADFNDVSASVGAQTGSTWQANPAIGIGLWNVITLAGSPYLLDTRVKYEIPNAGFTFGVNSTSYANSGGAVKAAVILHF